MLSDYYRLIKPGIIRGNAIPAIAGFCLASETKFSILLLLETLLGISLVIACGCVLNNYIDRDIDKKMKRTQKRALVTGAISAKQAIVYAIVLGLIGLVVLYTFTNALTAIIGLLGLFFYVVVYGIAKRKTIYGTLIGSISGALPPVAGYVAVSNRIDGAALSLFFILVFWQMPHFYSIAIFRRSEYKAARLPVLPVVIGPHKTKVHILAFIVLFYVASSSLYIIGYLGLWYLIVATILSMTWFVVGVKGLKLPNTDRWARSMFGVSLLVLSLLCIAISLGGILTS